MNLVTLFGLAQHDHAAVGFYGIPYRWNFFETGAARSCCIRVRRGKSFFHYFLCVFRVLDACKYKSADEGQRRRRREGRWGAFIWWIRVSKAHTGWGSWPPHCRLTRFVRSLGGLSPSSGWQR